MAFIKRSPTKLLFGGLRNGMSKVVRGGLRSPRAPIIIGAGVGVAAAVPYFLHHAVGGALGFASEAGTGDPNALSGALRETIPLAAGTIFNGLNPIVPQIAQGYDAMSHENIQAYYGGPSAPIGQNPLYDEMLQQQMAYSAARASNPMALNASGDLVFGLYNNRLK